MRRLNGLLDEDERNRLAEALFLDLIVKLPRSRCIDDVLVVTADASVARQARWFGHKVLSRTSTRATPRPRRPGARAAMAEGAERVAMLPVDCPMLDTDELDAAPRPLAAHRADRPRPSRHGHQRPGARRRPTSSSPPSAPTAARAT